MSIITNFRKSTPGSHSITRVITLCLMSSAGLGVFGCGPKTIENTLSTKKASCVSDFSQTIAGATGSGLVFNIDPRTSSSNNNLSPTSTSLDNYRSSVALSNLGGRGILEGTYVDVRSGQCDDSFGAYSSSNEFNFSQKDARFQEVMSYHYSDRFRAQLDQLGTGYLKPSEPTIVIAHCMDEDNAYYYRYRDSTNQIVDIVCMGDSVRTPGASYADDATVTIHELQHGTTVHTYSTTQELNRFWYDEAGAMNEAISDFMALIFSNPFLPGSFDEKIFSRWALGSFTSRPGHRGAHRCPAYDPTYPNCGNYSTTVNSGFSSASNRISYVYPDGLGWPYNKNFTAPGYVQSAFLAYTGQEAIHNNATIISGALWDIYSAIRANHSGDKTTARELSSKLVLTAVESLSKPTAANLSPVTFRELGSNLVAEAAGIGLNSTDQASVTAVLTERGLYGGSNISAGWAGVGTGKTETPGLKVLDYAAQLKGWLREMGFSNTSAITQTNSTLNNRADPGEVIALWFDISNSQAQTAGGLLLDVTSPDADITFLDRNYNDGYISSSRAQVRYSKINGSDIVSALSTGGASYSVPTTANYFGTNPHYAESWYTTLWMRVLPTAAHGKTINLTVKVKASNGSAEETLTFPITIN